jgi:GDP-mannose 6-dehydrogenase
MKVAILGLGYVGLTGAACLLSEGHDVLGIDINEAKLASIQKGQLPIVEPGVEESLQAGLSSNRLRLATSCAGQLAGCDVALVCVGTPTGNDGCHDMSHVAEASRQLAVSLQANDNGPMTVAFRSTFLPGTMERLIHPLFATHLGTPNPIELVYNPEFLRESTAMSDYFAPSRIVVGTTDGKPSATIDRLYEHLVSPRFVTKYREAEMIKLVDNSFHAVKTSFANEIGRICVELGISAAQVHKMFIADTKLNVSPTYLRPGAPFGGSCLPKDVRALSALSERIHADAFLVGSLLKTNEAHQRFSASYVLKGLAAPAKVLMNGIAFKGDSDDLRESPYIELAFAIVSAGHQLDIYDPCVKPELLVGQNLGYALQHLPELSKMLVDLSTVETSQYDRLIDVRGMADSFPGHFGSRVSIHALP